MLTYLFVMSLLATVIADDGINVAVDGTNKLGMNVYKVLAATPGNVLFCPVSAETLLALTYLGAGGRTAAEMAEVLHLPNDHNTIVSDFKSLDQTLKSNHEEVIFHSGNKMYISHTTEIKTDFNAKSVSGFRSETERLEFVKNVAAAKTINDWVEQQTNSKIKDLVDSSNLGALTRMVLVNAVYFLGKWKTGFALKHNPMNFHLNATHTKDVPQMKVKTSLAFMKHSELGASIVEIPYKDEDFVLTIILPDEIDGLAAVEAKLHTIDLSKPMSRHLVSVTIPKFMIEQRIELKDVLIDLGIKNAFRESANFTGITDDPLYISDVIQKTFIEVDEKGTEAAAATKIEIRTSSGPSSDSTKSFIADKPFLFMIINKGTLIFVGRVVEPNVRNYPH